ncbi:hypothetical protein D3C85_1294270 [compost metagenome]
MQPRQGATGLVDYMVQGHGRRQVVVQHHHAGTGGGQCRRHERRVGLGQRPPIATMDEQQHRGIRAAGGEDIQPLPRARTIGHILETRQARVGLVTQGAVLARVLVEILDAGAGVVLHVEVGGQFGRVAGSAHGHLRFRIDRLGGMRRKADIQIVGDGYPAS